MKLFCIKAVLLLPALFKDPGLLFEVEVSHEQSTMVSEAQSNQSTALPAHFIMISNYFTCKHSFYFWSTKSILSKWKENYINLHLMVKVFEQLYESKILMLTHKIIFSDLLTLNLCAERNIKDLKDNYCFSVNI